MNQFLTSEILTNYYMLPSKKHLELYIKKYLPKETSTEKISFILEKFSFLTLEKNNFLVAAGSICQYFCFIESGILQHTIMIDGVEKTTYLGLKNSATSALNSFKNSIPSRKNIKAISDCELWALTIKDFQELLEFNPVFKTFYFNLIENQIFLIDDYRINLLILSPEERYLKMLENEPTLLQQVPLQYLSSFLGISSRHMSRIRKNSI
ncbi:cyclic nucleotide-binding protein [Patiriisocius marinistellae]|uniref:Cyclic nucleotide-binding protein n=1 Tax=Patiriisocius marinistellae TaxID=2494560 RepID=A0A5J4FT45_9FLAO|nr:Crp/Fnr family transcriptional regulator [Patiriisocius marinistellae]GEQ84680.1 cyclic nucleotide-binding protein [Patiriisocius marinistellae]